MPVAAAAASSDALLTLFGAKHGLGGVAGYDAKEADDEDPDRLAIVQRMTCAYLRFVFHAGGASWPDARKALKLHANSCGRVDIK